MYNDGAYATAIAIAREKLTSSAPDWASLGLAAPGPDGRVRVRFLDRVFVLTVPGYALEAAPPGELPSQIETILVLHYLAAGTVPAPSGRLVSFRELPGGAFYWGPFRGRSTAPLAARTRNDLDALRRRLSRFEWKPVPLGDLGAEIAALGRLSVTLVYRAGDDEFPPEAEVFFDESVRGFLATEDAAVLAEQLCRRLGRDS